MRCFYILTTFVLIMYAAVLGREHEKVTDLQVPLAVLSAFNESYSGATIKEYVEENTDGHIIYEICCDYNGRQIDVLYNADGTVAGLEEFLSADELPSEIKWAIDHEFENATIRFVEKRTEDNVFYIIKLEMGDTDYRMLYSDAGEIIEKKKLDTNKK